VSWAAEIVEVHRRPLLRGVSFAVPGVGITAVVDRSKSAGALLFRMIAGLEPVDHGAVIARALTLQPPLLVADSFDDTTDAPEIEALSSAVREDRYRRGSAAVLFMGAPDLAARVADEVVDIQEITNVSDRSLD
jgi:predicted ABC-type transport system involved in lysophospholipase L1 biosynthesis ATPase subunit